MERIALLTLLAVTVIVGVGVCSNLGIGVTPSPEDRAVSPIAGECPASHPIKGTFNRTYHIPGGTFYAQAVPHRCYASPADAEASGYSRSAR